MNIECFLWVPVGTCGYLLAYVSTCWHMLASVGIGSTIGLVGAKEQQKKLDLFVISKHCVEQHLKLCYHFRIHSAR